MSGAFARAALAIAADRHMGQEAFYTPEGQAQTTVRVVLSRLEAPTGPGIGLVASGWVAMLPTALIPDRPQKGEPLSVGDRDFTIETAELDEQDGAWRLELRKVGTWQ